MYIFMYIISYFPILISIQSYKPILVNLFNVRNSSREIIFAHVDLKVSVSEISYVSIIRVDHDDGGGRDLRSL